MLDVPNPPTFQLDPYFARFEAICFTNVLQDLQMPCTKQIAWQLLTNCTLMKERQRVTSTL
jgi:hypothetical protein